MKKLTLLTAMLAGSLSMMAGEIIVEEDFAFAKPGTAAPQGWTFYMPTQLKGQKPDTKAEVRKFEDGCEVYFEDNCAKSGTGINASFSVDAGATYRATVVLAQVPGRNTNGACLQLSSGKAQKETPLNLTQGGKPETRTAELTIPEGQSQLTFYVFSGWNSRAAYIVRSIKIEETKAAPAVPVEIKPANGSRILLNDDFSKAAVKEGVAPDGWRLFYSTKLPKDAKPDARIAVEKRDGKNVVVVEDNCAKTGLGPQRVFDVTPGKTYRLSVLGRPLPKRDTAGFCCQFNLDKSFPIKADRKGKLTVSSLDYKAPEGKNKMTIYLYSNYDQKPAVEIHQVMLEELP